MLGQADVEGGLGQASPSAPGIQAKGDGKGVGRGAAAGRA